MEADFSGYATKAGLKCSDGRTIMTDAFKHQDKVKVPLVWQHGHTDPTNVLGHAILESREDGVYAYGFFNETEKAKHTRQLLEHGDINQLSIWANELVERSKRVFHGAIREVSLVLSGANPGALIENVTIRHSNGIEDVLEDEVIIYTGLTLEHSSESNDTEDDTSEIEESSDEEIQHAAEDDETLQDIYNAMSPKQKQVLHYMVAEALSAGEAVSHSLEAGDPTFKEIYEGMSDEQKTVLHYLVGETKEEVDIAHTDIDVVDVDETNAESNDDDSKGNEMKHNVFEQQDNSDKKDILSHDDMKSIVDTAARTGSLKHAVQEYALAHGITDIDLLFPDAKAVTDVPEWISRRVEWVGDFLGATRKSPFSRIKTLSADLTFEDARAKGYVKGTLKKEEFFGIASRSTTPTTVYKKQALDRDDVVDITDFDVVAWLKGEMRIMLDEEIARAALIGDGRDVSHEDKISEANIRPIAKDHELYTTTVNVNVGDANSSMTEVIDAVISNRFKLKGTGSPTFFTTEYWLSRFMLLRDADGHRMYKTLADLAAELRVSSVVPVEAMMDSPDIIGVIVNPVDYVMGATRGGEVSMFDDFDIDYNKQKYLIETRLCGALVKVKSAMVVKSTAAANVLVAPAMPGFVNATGVLTITDQTGVVYKNGATVVNAAGSPYAAIAAGASITIDATPAAGYYFATSDADSWTFTRDA